MTQPIMATAKARAVAFYLPQFHPIPENDAWWGKGFTEWTNTAKARAMFRGHYQPHVPADLGFYDLRVPEARAQQADLARSFGIEAFCYYHYWFAGRRILERPFDEVLASGQPDFPFCLCWANETWTGIWHGAPKRILIEQTYPGPEDHERHFQSLLPAFRDRRHLRVGGVPAFVVYKPHEVGEPRVFIDQWKAMAEQAGLGGLHIVGFETTVAGPELIAMGYDAVIKAPLIKRRTWVSAWNSRRNPRVWVCNKLDHLRGMPQIYDYLAWAQANMPLRVDGHLSYPCVVHAWDNTPRSGANGVVLRNPDPEAFRGLLSAAVVAVSDHGADQRLVFLKSWNEWAEGNHLEPDLRHGTAYLQVVADTMRDEAAYATRRA